MAQQAAPVEKTEETVAANEAAETVEVTPPKKDTRTKDERRRDRLALKTKARTEALEQGLPWDDNFKAIMFEENYKNAFKQATESPHAIEADILKASDAKIANMSVSPLVTANDNTETVTDEPATDAPAEQPVDTPPAEEAQPVPEGAPENDGKAGSASENTTGTTVEADPTVTTVDPWLKRDDETKAQWKGRKAQMRAAQKAEEAATKTPSEINKTLPLEVLEETTRNGDAPVEKRYPEGILGHHSDHDGQSIQPPAKSAKDAAAAFEAAAMGATDDNSTEVENVEQPTTATSVEEHAEPPVEENTTEENTAPADTTEQPTPSVPVEAEQPVTEKKRETLKLVPKSGVKPISDNSKGYVADAKKFYGVAFTDERAADLTDAYRLLCMAIRTEANGGQMADAALRNALKKEAEAFAIGVEQAKAA